MAEQGKEFAYVSIIISGPDLDPDEISGLLPEITPAHTHRKGDPRKSPPGRDVAVHPYDSGVWILRSSLPETASLEDHLVQLLGMLDERELEIKALSNQWRIFFNCDLWGPSGFEIPARLLIRIGAMGADF